jgi:Flp pilus assembly protein CpaB
MWGGPVTTTLEPAATAGADDAPTATPQRRAARSRVSAGHLVMVVAGLLAVLLNYSALRARDDTVRVAIAAWELRAGQTLSAADLAFTDLRAEPALLATLLEPAGLPAVQGWVVTSAVGPGELLRAGDLQPPSAPAAQRAMSIPVDPQHAVAGDLQAGDRVDVIEVEGRTASYLLVDAEVLAVPAAQTGGIAGGLQAFSVTIAVDDATALRLAVAIRGGQLELVRSTGSTPATTDRIDDAAEDAFASEDAASPGSGLTTAEGDSAQDAAAPEDATAEEPDAGGDQP